MTNTKKKNLKPIDTDIHLRYRCPDNKCSATHWLSLQEAQTLNFKIVCECGSILKPKRILGTKILYHKQNKQQINIPTTILEDSIKILTQYGFTKQEVTDLCNTHYKKSKAQTPESLVKYILQNLEHNNEQH